MAYQAHDLDRQRRERRDIDRAEQAQEHPAHQHVGFRFEAGSPEKPGDASEELAPAGEKRVGPFARLREPWQMAVQPPPGAAAGRVAQQAVGCSRAGVHLSVRLDQLDGTRKLRQGNPRKVRRGFLIRAVERRLRR